MSLPLDIQEAINKNLSVEVSKALQERLALADKLEKDVVTLHATLNRAETELIECRSQKGILERAAKAYTDLPEREAQLNKRQAALDIAEAVLKVRSDLASARVDDVKEMFKAVFANNTVKTQVFASRQSLVPPTAQNPYGSSMPLSDNASTTVEG